MVDRVFFSTQFMHGYKQLQKDHRTTEINKLNEIIIKLEKQEITTQSKNHPLNKGVMDIHISGDVILFYRYNTDGKLLSVSLELNNLVTHKELNTKLNNADKQTIKGEVEVKDNPKSLTDIVKNKR